MSIFETKMDEYRNKVLAEETKPKFLYIGSDQKIALQDKLGRASLSGQKYQGLEIVLVQRQSFFELG